MIFQFIGLVDSKLRSAFSLSVHLSLYIRLISCEDFKVTPLTSFLGKITLEAYFTSVETKLTDEIIFTMLGRAPPTFFFFFTYSMEMLCLGHFLSLHVTNSLDCRS